MIEELLQELIARYPVLSPLYDDIYRAFDLLCGCFDDGGKLLLCGNGGSAADCAHVTGELMKGFLLQRRLSKEQASRFDGIAETVPSRLQNGLPAIDLTSQSALMTAFCNDVDPEAVFAQQVWVYAQNSPDLLLCLSTSGSSVNVVRAAQTAKALGRKTVAITGKNGGVLQSLCDVCICLPETETYKVQELTLPVYHALCAAVESYYFDID